MQNKNFTGYVLAGGKSSRMGKDKALLEINNKTFLENAVDALQLACSSIKIVLNGSQTSIITKIPDDIPHIFDIYENRGAPGAIHAALKNCETEFAVVLAVDLPFVSSEAIIKLCEIALDSKDCSSIVPRQIDGKLQPLCAVYRVKDCLSKSEEMLLKNESASMRHFLETIKIRIVEAKMLTKTQNLFLNVNNSSEYENLINLKKFASNASIAYYFDMKKFFLSFIILIFTFGLGVYFYRISTPNVSLETISNNTLFYDGMNVEIETYAQLEFFDENGWYMGEPFEKREVFTYLNLERNRTNIKNLHLELKENLSKYHNKRAKVLVRGRIEDNCSGSALCCFGKIITIKAQEVIQLAPVEDYQRPE